MRSQAAAKSSQTSSPESETTDRSSSPASSRTTRTSRGARLCSWLPVSRTDSFRARRPARSAPREISTPCGWNCSRAARFSRVAGEYGSGVPSRTRWASAARRTSAKCRPATSARSGPSP
ncbi:hypothetical protein LUX05_09830 [Streptomyces somaliensis]|nr:hypothetical protein [Streptomyces somaliensis]